MKSLEDILYYLDTTAIVSCPQITQQQAAEIAAMLRKQTMEMETHEMALWLTRVAREQDQYFACGFAWDAGREMAGCHDAVDMYMRANSRSAAERDSARAELLEAQKRVASSRDYARAKDRELMHIHDALHRECDGNADLPAEIRALIAERDQLQEQFKKERSWSRKTGEQYDFILKQLDKYIERDRSRAPEFPYLTEALQSVKSEVATKVDKVEATGDLDPGQYEGTGKGFGGE